MEGYQLAFFWTSIILFIGFASRILMKEKKIPDSIFLILMGILLGPILHYFKYESYASILPIFSHLALMIILFESGLKLSIQDVLKNVGKGFLQSLTYFIVSTIFVSFIGYYIFHLPLLHSLLLGAILGGVSGPAAIPLFDRFIDSEDSKTICMLDSIFSDVFVVIVSLTVIEIISSGVIPTFEASLEPVKAIVSRFSVGAVIGFVSALFWIKIMKLFRKEKYTYMLTLAFGLLVYTLTEIVGGSGAIASLAMGLILGNFKEISEMFNFEEKFKIKGVFFYLHEEISFLIRTFFFVVLGALFNFSSLDLSFLLGTIGIVLIMVLARYLSILPFIKQEDPRFLVSLIVPRGLGAAIIAVLLLQYDIDMASFLSQVVTVAIILSNILPIIFLPIAVKYLSREKPNGLEMLDKQEIKK